MPLAPEQLALDPAAAALNAATAGCSIAPPYVTAHLEEEKKREEIAYPVCSSGLLALTVAVGVAAGKETRAAATTPACVLLPDTKSSVRWETQDRPTFVAAFKKAGIAATRRQRRG